MWKLLCRLLGHRWGRPVIVTPNETNQLETTVIHSTCQRCGKETSWKLFIVPLSEYTPGGLPVDYRCYYVEEETHQE